MKLVKVLKTGATVMAMDAPTGVCGFISWHRLAEVLKQSGEFKDGETLTHFTADHNGITMRFEK